MFLNAVSPEAVEVFNSFNLDETKKKNYADVIKSFDEFCKPKKNIVYDTFIFHSRQQRESEPFDSFLIDLKKLVRACVFGECEKRILLVRLVFGIRDKNLQKRLLESDNLGYDKAVEMARAAEASWMHTSEMQRKPSSVDAINRNKFLPNHPHKNVNRRNENEKRFICKYCAATHSYGQCKAFGRACLKFGKQNHFAVACRFRNIREIHVNNSNVEESVNDDEEFHIDSVSGKFEFDSWYECVRILESDIIFKLDSGAEFAMFCHWSSLKKLEI